MISYRYSYTQTIAPPLMFKLEQSFKGDISKIILFCKYYFDMYLHDPNIVKEYWIMPEIFGLVDKNKPISQENVKNVRLHFHGIIIVNDYNLFCKKYYSLTHKLGFGKLNYINCEDRFMKANNYMFKFQNINPPIIDYFSTYINKISDNDKVIIWNCTHKKKKDPVFDNINRDIMTYFQ